MPQSNRRARTPEVLAAAPAAADAAGRPTFKILTLSGGGARGVFQAAFLEGLEANGTPLRERFDMIAATSTGAIVGLAIAYGLQVSHVTRMYQDHLREIFRHRRMGLLRRGGRYNPDSLRNLLEREFGTARLGDLDLPVLIVTSVADTYQGRIFTEADVDVTLVDAALASSAAPTYFPPGMPTGQARGYLDGGLWANDPSFVAVADAIYQRNVAPDCVRLLSVGTGRIEQGEPREVLARLRSATPDTIRLLVDVTSGLQAWAAERFCSLLLSPDQIVRVNPFLPHWIPLNDADAALSVLLPRAESEYEAHAEPIQRLLTSPAAASAAMPPDVPLHLRRVIADSGLTRFTPSRQYYPIVREGRETISSYVSLARATLTMVSINLATGDQLENIIDTFGKMVRRADSVRIKISLLDYRSASVMEAIAEVLNRTPQGLAGHIEETVLRLKRFAEQLPHAKRQYVQLYLHKALPNASAILIDEATTEGLIQLETKPYRAGSQDSFGFEVKSGTPFYNTLVDSYNTLINDSEQVYPVAANGE